MLQITNVAKALDFQPSRPCLDTLYAPCYVRVGDRELMFAMGGHVDASQPSGLTDPDRFADKIYVSERAYGTEVWGAPQLAISKATFPWMQDDSFLRVNPEAFIGSVAGPQVVKLGDWFHMFFSATVNDPNICTGEHDAQSPHGSCTTPWSYFALFHAQSRDGLMWKLADRHRSVANVALSAAMAYYEPSAAEKIGHFKGIAMPHSAIFNDDLLTIFIEHWTSGEKEWQRNAVLRTNGLVEKVWNGVRFEPITGALPQFANDSVWIGNPFAHIVSHVTLTTHFPGYRYILLAQGAGLVYGGRGVNNCIEYALSNDLLTWTPAQIVETKHPALNGQGADNVCLNPHYYEYESQPRILFATSDWNGDGNPDCPAGGYYGMAVFEGRM